MPAVGRLWPSDDDDDDDDDDGDDDFGGDDDEDDEVGVGELVRLKLCTCLGYIFRSDNVDPQVCWCHFLSILYYIVI